MEITITNTDAIRAMTDEQRVFYFNAIEASWVGRIVSSNQDDMYISDNAGYWATLAYVNKRPTVFRHNPHKLFRVDMNAKSEKIKREHLVKLWNGILDNTITGDVVLYRSGRCRWPDLKYPIHHSHNNTFFIMTGRTEWTNRAIEVYEPQEVLVHSSMLSDFQRFKSQCKHSEKIGAQKHMSQRLQAAKQWIRRTAAIYSILNLEQSEWSVALTQYNEPTRCGFLAWSQGKVLTWWHVAHNTPSPLHIIPPNTPILALSDDDITKYLNRSESD